jgi:hypothetical protein
MKDNMFGIIKPRNDRLRQILSQTEVIDDLDLLKSCSMSKGLELWYSYNDIYWSVLTYIKKSIAIYYKENYEHIVTQSLAQLYTNATIGGLPNLTPNGILLPKRETIKYYYKIHNAVRLALNKLGISSHIQKIHCPITVRISGGFLSNKDERPRASSKIHTDVWSGEPTNTTMVFIPIDGDFKRAGIDFYKTPEDILHWLRPLDDYNEGKAITDIAAKNKYDIILEKNKLYLSDPLLLHATHKELPSVGPSPFRVSIDFRFISDIRCPYDTDDNPRERSYIDYATWSDIGYKWDMYTPDSIFDIINGDTAPINAYSGYYELKERHED